MSLLKTLAVYPGAVVVAQLVMAVVKVRGWEPVAKHTWLTLAWFPWAFLMGAGLLAGLMLVVGMAFSGEKIWKLETWVMEEPQPE